MNSQQKKRYPWTPIRNLVVVLFSGVFFAAFAALLMLYYYGPTGRYLVANTLLSPQTMQALSYKASNLRPGNSTIYQFDRIEYAHWEAEKKQWQRTQIMPEEYGRLYQSIADEKSILDVSNEIVNQFYVSPPSKLTIYVKSQGENRSLEESSITFQTAEFSNAGDYFRVELRGLEGDGGWAYFYHPQIQQQVTDLFLARRSGENEKV